VPASKLPKNLKELPLEDRRSILLDQPTTASGKPQCSAEAVCKYPLRAVRDLYPAGKDIVYINATSTRECTFALSFAREYA
jgi:hypothetical protein